MQKISFKKVETSGSKKKEKYLIYNFVYTLLFIQSIMFLKQFGLGARVASCGNFFSSLTCFYWNRKNINFNEQNIIF